MRIGELSERSGFSVKTLRYYDDIGLVRPERRNPASNVREYGEESLDLLALVRSSKSAGLELRQIKRILTAAKEGSACKEVIPLLTQKLDEIEHAIKALQNLRTRLTRALKRGLPKVRGGCRCPILHGLDKNFEVSHEKAKSRNLQRRMRGVRGNDLHS